jgi:AcrR family transcriptional regulator
LISKQNPKSARLDGRRLRSARTKQAIVEAYVDLLREDPKIPTAAQIAERAGVSVRSVFERFSDLHELRVAATDYTIFQVASQAVAGDTGGDRATRLKSHVETRGAICETWLPLWRAMMVNKGDSPALNSRAMLARQAIIRRIEMMYQPELSTLPDPQRQHLLIVLEALIDFESWARMREGHGLSPVEACEVWIEAIDRLLPQTPPVS